MFPRSKMADKWLGHLDNGIEIGGSAQNSFGLKTVNCDWSDRMDTAFKLQEIDLVGRALPVDIVAEGDCLDVIEDHKFNFLLSSHVFEHMPNPIKALLEWHRVVITGGLLYLVIPLRDTNEYDAARPVSTPEKCIHDFLNDYNVDTYPAQAGVGWRGHHHVWSLVGFLKYIEVIFSEYFDVVDTRDPDDKVSNGFVVVMRTKEPVNKITMESFRK